MSLNGKLVNRNRAKAAQTNISKGFGDELCRSEPDPVTGIGMPPSSDAGVIAPLTTRNAKRNPTKVDPMRMK